MPNVTNISMGEAIRGQYPSWVSHKNTIFIQIEDYDNSGVRRFCNAKNRYQFDRVYQFRFEDINEYSDASIQPDQAKDIANALRYAKENNKHVLVHCHAGLCRSGAVTEVATMFGFDDVDKNVRIPNTLVKKMLCRELGMMYSWEEEDFDRTIYNNGLSWD